MELLTEAELVDSFLAGAKLKRAELTDWESQILRDPANSVLVRCRVLGYYEIHQHFKSDRVRRREHILWLIRNGLGLPLFSRGFGLLHEGDEEARLELLANVQRDASVTNLLSAAIFLCFSWELEGADTLLNRAMETSPHESANFQLIARVQRWVSGRRANPPPADTSFEA